jgi:tetratricopeptide (TPR) repeat protein
MGRKFRGKSFGRVGGANSQQHAVVQKLNNSAILKRQRGDIAGAIEDLKKAFLLQQDDLNTLLNLTTSSLFKGDSKAALEFSQKTVFYYPEVARVHECRGMVLVQVGRFGEAVEHFQKAIYLDPRRATVYCSLGTALNAIWRADEALIAFDRAIALDSASWNAYFGKSIVLRVQNRHLEALQACESAVKYAPEYGDLYAQKALILCDLDRYDEAIVCADRAIGLTSSGPLGFNVRGLVLMRQGRLVESEQAFRRAMELTSSYVDAHFNLSVVLFLQGKFEEAWREHEWRWNRPKYTERAKKFIGPRWEGSDLNGKRILLYREQGLGDSVQFIRYASMVKVRGGHVIFECQPPLVKLLSGVDGVDEIVAEGNNLPDFDLHIPLLSLPLIFNTRPETVPLAQGYINQSFDSAWRRPERFCVGLKWMGNPNQANDARRSIPLEVFRALTNVPEVEFVNLEIDQRAHDEVRRLHLSDRIKDMRPFIRDFADTAGIMQRLDLVISVCTSVTHVAGALGRPVWTLLPFCPDWRWMFKGDTTPWYSSMRLFRQSERRDWAEVIAQVSQELQQLSAGSIQRAA